MVVNEAGRVRLYAPMHNPILNRRYYHRLEFSDLQKAYMNRIVEVGVDKRGDPVYSPAAVVWLTNSDRRQFIGGVTFDPTGNHQDPAILNLWEGLAVMPTPGRWNLMKDHILGVICVSNREHYDYRSPGWRA
jgi:hypothetical protein